ncbi:hypothetical protein V5O48_002817 [Marasmius crinis-equi]|uniref:Rho-GAP domain-containing protein n=1 Tax=Marasmius crinis-equi TaxID=585013 RepID=A0ABR3FUK8_9AGAR
MSDLNSALRILLRDSDEILSLIEAFHIPETPKSAQDGSLSTAGPELDNVLGESRNKRVLAVVVHRDEASGLEEGRCVSKHPSNGYPDELDIRHVFPICGDFTISMSQVKPQSIDLRSSTRSHSSNASISSTTTLQQGSGLKLTINPGINTSEPLSFFTYDVQGLRTILAESRRLKEVSEQSTAPISPAQTFSWLATYTSRSIHIPTLSTIPPDLRLEHLPLHTRLSDASAGVPGDDADDILYIREEWVRTRARETCRKGRAKLNVRIGTFNVNGKMPSQDLATWVRGASSGTRQESVLPPVKELSPLSLGESNKNPLDKVTEKRPPSPSARSTSTAYSATLNNEDGTGNIEPAIPISLTIDQDHPDDPDILVFGFQELDLSTEALIYSTSTTREDAWCMAIFAALGEKATRYEKLASKQLVGMLIVIIVKSSLRSCFSNMMASSVGVGLMGVMGNKGGTAIRLTFTPPPSGVLQQDSDKDGSGGLSGSVQAGAGKESAKSAKNKQGGHHDIKPGPTTLTFVCSHLAAFDEMVEKRHADYQYLTKKLAFLETPDSVGLDNTTIAPATSGVVSPSRSASMSSGGGSGISTDSTPSRTSINGVPVRRATVEVPAQANPDVSAGAKTTVLESLPASPDLNYRIDLPDSDVRAILGAEHWEDKFSALLKHDQLKNAIRNNKAFDLFSEHTISHLPRKPAWTDRVLYAHSPLTSVLPRSYAGHPEITMSDHKPVSADFTIDVDMYDKNELSAAAKHLFRQLHGIEENQSRGKTQLSDSVIDMGDIAYRKPVKRTFTIQNTGKVPSAFRFVPLDVGSEIHPDWLKVTPLTGLLLPNEAQEIVLSVLVDNHSAFNLNLGSRKLDCTLILHTLLGKDHFISVSGEYQYTCFANRLSRLTRLPGPIRSLKDPHDLLHEDRAINAPREVMRLVNWMMTSGHHAMDDIFATEADQSIVGQIRECLDTGDEFPFSAEEKDVATLVAFGETLLNLLASLPEGLIPDTLYSQCGQATSRDEAFEILDALHPASVNVWISVTAFLHFVAQSSSQPQVKAEKIAAKFAPILMRDPPDTPISPLMPHRFVLHFIQ